jgi:Ca2+-binding RTX toxin-like protein
MTRRFSPCEQLEGRTLFSLPPLTTVTFNPIIISNEWVVNGTDADDTISIRADADFIHVTVNGVTQTGAAWFYKKVTVNGNDGLDTLNVDPSVKCRVAFNGGMRNDTLIANPAFDSGPIDFNGGGTGAGTGGRDTANFGASAVDFTVSLDGVANDGRKDRSINNIMSDVEEVFTGSGRDTLRATDGHNTFLHGGAGNDNITGANGNDILDGGEDHDWLIGNLGADNIKGGLGTDMVSYIDRQVPLTILLNGENGSGAVGEGDIINKDVENVIGGQKNDTIRASAGFIPHVFFGEGGDDILIGGEGNCVYWPGAGNDRIELGTSVNKVFAEDGVFSERDTIVRKGGSDEIHRDLWDIVQ